MPVFKKNVSFDPRIAQEIKNRGSEFSPTMGRMLERYLEIIRRARANLSTIFSVPEMSLILDVVNGIDFSAPIGIAYIAQEIADSAPDGVGQKWNVDVQTLAQKIDGLSYGEKVALVDTCERWWDRVGAGEIDLQPAAAFKL